MRTDSRAKKHLLVPQFFDRLADASLESLVDLPDVDAQHLANVLRARIGDLVTISDGAGHWCRAQVANIVNGRVALAIDVDSMVFSPRREHIHLYIGLAKPKVFGLAIQKATELGVSTITPIITDRCNAKDVKKLVDPTANESQSRVHRWQENIRQAARQSENLWLPQIECPQGFGIALGEAIAASSGPNITDERVVAHPTGQAWADYMRGSTMLKKAGSQQAVSNIVRTSLWIGPEGGFTHDELSALKEHGFSDVSIHYNVLRVETATVAAIALISLRNSTQFASEATAEGTRDH